MAAGLSAVGLPRCPSTGPSSRSDGSNLPPQSTESSVPAPERRMGGALRHQWDTPDPRQCKGDGIKLRQQVCRTTGTPPRREAESSSPTSQSEPLSLARRSTRPTNCDDQLARLTLPVAH